MSNRILLGDCYRLLQREEPVFSLVYMDPPFNTGDRQFRKQRGGGVVQYSDGEWETPKQYHEWLLDRILLAYNCLNPTGTIMVHLDWHEVHHIKVLMDFHLGRTKFLNELIWAYDYGARSKKRWSTKHDTILVYTKDPEHYTFNYDEIDRIPYLSPSLVGKDKAAKGKTPTDCWEEADNDSGDYWFTTIVPTGSKENLQYPTQKPLRLLNRIIKVHTNPGDWVLDPFGGSGTLGEAAGGNGRNFVLMDKSEDAVRLQSHRLERFEPSVLYTE